MKSCVGLDSKNSIKPENSSKTHPADPNNDTDTIKEKQDLSVYRVADITYLFKTSVLNASPSTSSAIITKGFLA